MILPKTPRQRGENSLIAVLPPDERATLQAHLTRTPLNTRKILQEPDQPIEQVWFIHSGVMSMISEMEDGGIVEFASVGREGVVGVPILLGADRMSQRVFCQIPGEADAIAASVLRRLLDQIPTLRRLMLRYVVTLITQMAQGSACNRLHPIEARCARWLLMTHDRVDGDSFPLTQEFLAQMLGVTRPSVSIAAGMLQKAGLITYVRGVITILDRTGLGDASCECYGVITREFQRLVEDGVG